MRGFAGYKTGTELVAKTTTIPSPTRGLNTRDPQSLMEAGYAINLTNWVAAPGGCKVREGYRVRNTGLPGYVETLAAYTPASSGQRKLFAWSGAGIYDVTNPGAVGAPVVTGLLNAKWATVNMTTPFAQYLVCANGADSPRHFDGTSWVTWTTTASPTTPGQVSGINVALLKNPIVHQRRVWFVESGSSKAWYLPINSVGGTANFIDFGASFPRGGALTHLASWSIDGGQGLKSMLVAVSENGDTVIYEGADPSNAATFTISGTWRLAPPTSDRPLFQFGGDVLYLSVDGLMPLSQYMQDTQTAVALSDTIRPTLAELAATQGTLSGWQIHDVLSKNLLVLNVPQINPLSNFQFVFNTITQGWSMFTGWPAQCWASISNTHFFGGFQQVCTAFSGFKDNAANDGSGGAIYTASAQGSWDYLSENARARQKRITLMRMNLVSSSPNPNLALAVNADFDTTPPSSIGAAVPITASLWDVGSWNSATWGGGVTNYNVFQSVNALGYCVSPVVACSVQAETQWVSTELVFEVGGII